jgi:hypothetical protein
MIRTFRAKLALITINMMEMQFKPQTQKDIGMLKKIKNSLS